MPKTTRKRSSRFYRTSRGSRSRAAYARRRAGKSRRTRFASNRRGVSAKTVRAIVKRQIRSNVEYHKQYFYANAQQLFAGEGISSTVATDANNNNEAVDSFILEDITPPAEYIDNAHDINYNIWRAFSPSDVEGGNVSYTGTDSNKLLLTHFDIKILMENNSNLLVDPFGYYRIQIIRSKARGVDEQINRNGYYRQWHQVAFTSTTTNAYDRTRSLHAVQHKNAHFTVIRDTKWCKIGIQNSRSYATPANADPSGIESLPVYKEKAIRWRIPLNQICKRPNVTNSGYYISDTGTGTSDTLPTDFPELYRYSVVIMFTGEYAMSPAFSYTCSYGWKDI